MNAGGTDKAEAENILSGTLKTLFAVADYDLKKLMKTS